MPADLITELGRIVGSSLVASFLYFAAKRRGTDEEIKPKKMAITLAASFLVALALYATGTVTDAEEAATQLTYFVGPVAIWLQGLVKRYQSGEFGSNAVQ